MSTRAVIARPKGDEWEGRYHHSDGYPTGLGATLWALVKESGVEWAQRTLLDEHTGWSTINGADWAQSPGYGQKGAPACYCHGMRSEEGWWIDPSSDTDTEWCYVLGALGMTVYARTRGGWLLCGSYLYDGPEPTWDQIEKGER